MRWSFHATDTTAQADEEVADCSFTGPKGVALGLLTEDGVLVRLAWHDGSAGEDEAVVALRQVTLAPGRVSLTFERDADGWLSEIPYTGVDLTYDDVDDRSADLEDVFARLLEGAPDRLTVKR